MPEIQIIPAAGEDVANANLAVAEGMGERRGKGNPDNCPDYKGAETRDIAAARSGFSSGKQYERAKTVVAANDDSLTVPERQISRKSSTKSVGEILATPNSGVAFTTDTAAEFQGRNPRP